MDKKLSLLLLFVLLMPFISSVSLSTIQYNNQSIELNTYCKNYDDKSYCDNSTSCFVMMQYANGTKIINFESMSFNSTGLFNYTDNTNLNSTLSIGDYRTSFICSNNHGISKTDSFITLSSVSITSPGSSGGGGRPYTPPVDKEEEIPSLIIKEEKIGQCNLENITNFRSCLVKAINYAYLDWIVFIMIICTIIILTEYYNIGVSRFILKRKVKKREGEND